jgi:hypothetical protein
MSRREKSVRTLFAESFAGALRPSAARSLWRREKIPMSARERRKPDAAAMMSQRVFA